MTTTYDELREAIARSRVGQTRWRCPVDLREKIAEFAKERKNEGVGVGEMAKSLGVSESGLSRWLGGGKPKLRPVRVAEQAPSHDRLVLVTPGGYRLEGLSASSAADLLRRLGC